MPDITPPAGSSGAGGGLPTGGSAGQMIRSDGSAGVWVDNLDPVMHLLGNTMHESVPRLACSQNPSWTSGDAYYAYFTARWAAPITKIGTIFTNAGSTGSLTIGKLSLWTANSDATGATLVSQAAGSNDVNMGSAAGSYEQTVSFTLVPGTRYCIIGVAVHTYTTAPKVVMGLALTAQVVNASPRISGKSTGQTDTPAAAAPGANNLTPFYAYVR